MKTENSNEVIVFAGGCFWCTEAVFKMIKGVRSVEPGYTGGIKPNPTYEEVCSGTTGHAEAVRIVYDPTLAKLRNLLIVFFGSHDPTTDMRQPARLNDLSRSGGGNDVGTQYRSAVFYTTDEQKNETEKIIKEINESSSKGEKVVTEVKPLGVFYPAENYHKDYFANNPSNPYCMLVINPKLEKVQKEFAELFNK